MFLHSILDFCTKSWKNIHVHACINHCCHTEISKKIQLKTGVGEIAFYWKTARRNGFNRKYSPPQLHFIIILSNVIILTKHHCCYEQLIKQCFWVLSNESAFCFHKKTLLHTCISITLYLVTHVHSTRIKLFLTYFLYWPLLFFLKKD